MPGLCSAVTCPTARELLLFCTAPRPLIRRHTNLRAQQIFPLSLIHIYTNTPVHKEIVSITDGELLGSEAVRNVVIVDLSQPAGETAGQFVAWKKPYSVIPDTEGDSTDAYTYSGTLRTAGESVKGYATSDDNWETLTFTEGEPSPAG